MPVLSENEYTKICSFLKNESGLDLGPPFNKEYLLVSRLEPLAQTLFGLKNLSELIERLEKSSEEMLRKAVIEAMTTNETFFFRDPKTFDYLSKIHLPELLKSRPHKIYFWSAASSSGQEAMTIIMMMEELRSRFPELDYSILGTDLSANMVERCREASYSKFEVQRGLSPELLEKYFKQVGSEYVFNRDFLRKTEFREMNLMHPEGLRIKFDVIFCRNVLIYFENQMKEKILSITSEVLRDDGVLVLGGTESLLQLRTPYSNCGINRLPIYGKKQGGSK